MTVLHVVQGWKNSLTGAPFIGRENPIALLRTPQPVGSKNSSGIEALYNAKYLTEMALGLIFKPWNRSDSSPILNQIHPRCTSGQWTIFAIYAKPWSALPRSQGFQVGVRW